MAPKVFLVTGSSTGFGAELVQVILDKGDIAVATARDPKKLSFQNTTEGKNYLGLALDVTDSKSIDAALQKAVDTFGRIDVVVNNAGYGLKGPFEGYTDADCRQQMEVNFFGLIDVTRKALPILRKQGGGLIQQVTSIGGLNGVPTYTLYCASKHAVEGFSESLLRELKPEWGIKITCIEPGGFRTDWSGRSMQFGSDHEAYDHINSKKDAAANNGSQAGDPKKGALAMYEFAIMSDPPSRAIVGTDAYDVLEKKLKGAQETLVKYKDLSRSTNVDE